MTIVCTKSSPLQSKSTDFDCLAVAPSYPISGLNSIVRCLTGSSEVSKLGDMKLILWLIFLSLSLSFLLGTGFTFLFSYKPYNDMGTNLLNIYTNLGFWKGFGIWSLLYLGFFSLIFLPKMRSKES